MKKSILLLLSTIVLISVLGAQDIMQPNQNQKPFEFKGYKETTQPQLRDQDPAPNYSFIPNADGENTVYLYDSYYDYMPYSYNGYNIRIQPETSSPYGWTAGGIYASYMVSETNATQTDRRAWNSYINPDGTLLGSTATNLFGVYREGYTSIAIDPVTANPFFAWHAITEADNTYDVHMTYDNYHITGATGYWKQPFILIDNPEDSEAMTGHGDDEFIWPVIQIGDSPIEGHRRIHAYANNFTNNSGGHGNYNSIYAYADFNADSLLYEAELSWTKTTFPEWDYEHYNDLNRVNKDMIIKDNLVVFYGNIGDSLFVKMSDDYGQNFVTYKEEWKFPVENPMWEDGSAYAFYDNDETTPSVLSMVLSNDGSHYNGVLTGSNERLVWMSGINLNNQENIDTGFYMPAFFYPKIFSFDMETHDFKFYDMVLQGADPADENPMIPWDLDENGVVDEYYDDGDVYVPLAMASWFYNTDDGYGDSFFHESNFKMVANGNWVVAAWHECTKHRWAYWGIEGYENWLYYPEIAFSISDDGGQTWSDTRYINANPADNVVDPDTYMDGNYNDVLQDMIPIDITFGDKLEILSNEAGNYHAKAHIGFFDDNDYGSAAGQTEGGGELNGGKIRYAALDIEFSSPWEDPVSSDEDTTTPSIVKLRQNYPNPFNPVTTIEYSVKEEAKVEIEVYNLKGQKIKTLVNDSKLPGDYKAIWEGRDDNGNSVASGVYFYRLKSGNETGARKMVLMK